MGMSTMQEAAELLASTQGDTSRRAALSIIRAASLNCHSYEVQRQIMRCGQRFI